MNITLRHMSSLPTIGVVCVRRHYQQALHHCLMCVTTHCDGLIGRNVLMVKM